VNGIFMVDGRRLFRSLGREADFARTESGKLRTERQVNQAIDAAWETRREALETERARTAGTRRPIKDVLEEWIAKAPDNNVQAATVANFMAPVAAQYLAAVGNHPLGDITIAHVDRFKTALRERRLAPTTANARLSRLRAFLNWARKRGYLEAVPEIEMVKVPRRPPRIPTHEQVAALADRLQRCATETRDPRHRYYFELHYMLFQFALGCGLRRSAAPSAKWEHVDLERGLILVHSKGGESLVFMPGSLVDYLRERRARYPLHVWLFEAPTLTRDGSRELAYRDTHALTVAFRRHMEAVGIPGGIKPLHSFRAYLVSIAVDRLGLDARTASRLLGHTSIRTTEAHYMAGDAQQMRRAVDLIDSSYLSRLAVGKLLEPRAPILQQSDTIQ
jgi:integrase